MNVPVDPIRPRTSWALQGCLFGAVALFVVLLIAILYLAYQRFREGTAPRGPAPVPAAVQWRLQPVARTSAPPGMWFAPHRALAGSAPGMAYIGERGRHG
jgi:hypothetical protein